MTPAAAGTQPPAPGASSVALGFGDIRVRPGEHVAHFYQADGERRDLLVPFIEAGISSGEKCVHVAPPDRLEAITGRLREAGVDAEAALDAGQLVLQEGLSTPEELTERLSAALADAGDRFERLRWSGDMTWAIDRMDDSRALMRWESACNQVDEPERVVFFCQYSLSAFPGTVVVDALRTHSTCVIGRALRQNSLYEDPGAFLERLEKQPATALERS